MANSGATSPQHEGRYQDVLRSSWRARRSTADHTHNILLNGTREQIFFFLLRKVSLDLRLLEVYASVATRARLWQSRVTLPNHLETHGRSLSKHGNSSHLWSSTCDLHHAKWNFYCVAFWKEEWWASSIYLNGAELSSAHWNSKASCTSRFLATPLPTVLVRTTWAEQRDTALCVSVSLATGHKIHIDVPCFFLRWASCHWEGLWASSHTKLRLWHNWRWRCFQQPLPAEFWSYMHCAPSIQSS